MPLRDMTVSASNIRRSTIRRSDAQSNTSKWSSAAPTPSQQGPHPEPTPFRCAGLAARTLHAKFAEAAQALPHWPEGGKGATGWASGGKVRPAGDTAPPTGPNPRWIRDSGGMGLGPAGAA